MSLLLFYGHFYEECGSTLSVGSHIYRPRVRSHDFGSDVQTQAKASARAMLKRCMLRETSHGVEDEGQNVLLDGFSEILDDENDAAVFYFQ